jgi:hypothetical protein
MAEVRVRASLVVWVVLITSLVVGQTAARAEDAEKARQLFSQGSKFYDVGQFDKAIEAWQQGYDQKPDPSFLFNIAQAYRQKDDPKQAIFFYKSYLRNSPKAANRVDVEQRIAALQRQIDTGVKAPPTAGPPPPAVTTTPPPPTSTPPPPPTATEPPPPPPTSPPPATFAEGPPVVTAQGESEQPFPPRRFDLLGGIGGAVWTSGLAGSADPSFAFSLGTGYTFGQPSALVRFRLGALFGWTFLSEGSGSTTWTEHFLSFLVDPTLDVRLSSTGKWVLSFDIGIGVMAITGLKKSSALLDGGDSLVINGAQSMALTRFGAALQYQLNPNVGLFVWPAIATSPKQPHFHAAITRFETLIGAAYRF